MTKPLQLTLDMSQCVCHKIPHFDTFWCQSQGSWKYTCKGFTWHQCLARISYKSRTAPCHQRQMWIQLTRPIFCERTLPDRLHVMHHEFSRSAIYKAFALQVANLRYVMGHWLSRSISARPFPDKLLNQRMSCFMIFKVYNSTLPFYTEAASKKNSNFLNLVLAKLNLI